MARMITLAFVMLGAIVAAAEEPTATVPVISVHEDGGGAYTVTARFSVPERAAAVRAVLTDYEQIPGFMPGVRLSRVLERGEGHARVEQEAVSKFMLFSKRVHLVLDVDEAIGVISFHDLCGKSFARYEGAWTITEQGDRTLIEYRLAAAPAFEVPGFVLRKLLDRDARAMIDGLRAAIRARALAS